MSESDMLLTWLQNQCEEIKKDLKQVGPDDLILPSVLEGRLDAYRNVIAFVQTGGKLR